MEKIVSTITDIVPQITYDIIARFVPGTMVILSWIIVCTGPEEALNQFNDFMADPNSIIGWSVVLFLLAAYIVSIVLYGIWKLGAVLLSCGCAICECISNLTPLKKICAKILPYWQRFTRCIKDEHRKENEHDKKYPPESLMYDAIRVKSPVVGSRMVKLRAEVRQAQVLIVGWGITFILYLFTRIENYPIRARVLLEVALGISIIGLYLFRRHIDGKYVTNLKNHWHILQLDQEPWFIAKDKSLSTMPKFAIYYVPQAEEEFYRRGTSILGYDVRARKPVQMPKKTKDRLGSFDQSWVQHARPYGFHLTIGDAIDFVPGDIQLIERELEDLLHCFAPDHRFTLQWREDDFVTVWDEKVVVLRYDPNDYLRTLHTLVVARLHTLGSGSGYLERHLKDPKQYIECPHKALKVRKFYSPTALDDYAPHFTLLNPYTGDRHDELRQIFLEMFGSFEKIKLKSICLLVQMNKDEPWEIYREFKLSSGSRV